jgi:hypothetical protein
MSKLFLPTYLYVKTHNITGLKYFGKTTGNPYNYRGSGKYWIAHLKKHNNNVTTEIIGYFDNKEECISVATKFSINNNIVNAVNKNNKKIWANQIIENGTDGGATRINFQHSIETKRKISEAHKGMKVTEEAKEKIRKARAKQGGTRNGQTVSAETKAKLRKANLGKKHSDATKQKRSQSLKGHVVSEETKQKLREANLGKKMSAEAIEKMRNKVVSEEQKQHLREVNLGKKASDATKKKLSGKVVVIDKAGKLLRITKEQYYAQIGSKINWEWIMHRCKEAKMRRG